MALSAEKRRVREALERRRCRKRTFGRGDGGAASWQGRMFRAWDAIWMRLFRDAPIPRRRHLVLEHYVISTLSGLASTLMLEGGAAALRDEELALLTTVLIRELDPGA